VRIKKIDYFSAADIQQEIGVARQTLWRWRKAKKIPQGRRYRDRQVVFTKQEVEEIREYANRLEPAEPSDVDQMKLFSSNSPKRRVS
jgi:predicted DNA-binding transcriptional regulator AlpA